MPLYVNLTAACFESKQELHRSSCSVISTDIQTLGLVDLEIWHCAKSSCGTVSLNQSLATVLTDMFEAVSAR